MIEGVIITPLDVVNTIGGNVLHGMKSTDQGYSGFGEAYFSTVESGAIKGWKRHHLMTLNLMVPVGAIRFVIYDDRQNSPSTNKFQQILLSRSENYSRLTIPPMVWLGFQGREKNTNISWLPRSAWSLRRIVNCRICLLPCASTIIILA